MGLVHLEFTGVVQGVGFRWFVRQHARAFGVSGWVRNESSGAVRVAARGDDKVLAEFVEAIRQGPPGSRVEEVRQLPAETAGDLPENFVVLR